MDCKEIPMDKNEKVNSKNEVHPDSRTSSPQSLDTQSHDNHAEIGMFRSYYVLTIDPDGSGRKHLCVCSILWIQTSLAKPCCTWSRKQELRQSTVSSQLRKSSPALSCIISYHPPLRPAQGMRPRHSARSTTSRILQKSTLHQTVMVHIWNFLPSQVIVLELVVILRSVFFSIPAVLHEELSKML